MKVSTLLVAAACSLLFVSCGNDPYKNVDPEIAAKAQANIATATPERAEALTQVLKDIKPEYREGMAYLYAYMPKHDIDTLSTDLIKENIEYAYKAYETFPWVKDLPKDIFYNEVLPYVCVDETRDSWRPMFFEMFGPMASASADMAAAIDTVNKSIKEAVDVVYNVKRRRPNQSPSESMEIHMASCTGLSILLIDAFRAVGIPARFAGTPMWVSREGNHNWVEVWLDGEWYVTEYSPEKLNYAWFMPRAGKADKNDKATWIYATSYAPTGMRYPMVWNRRDTTVHGIEVTDRYIALYKSQQTEEGKGTPVAIRMFKKEGGEQSSADRMACEVKLFNLNNDVVGTGVTAGPTKDMNDYLVIYSPVNGIFEVEYPAADGSLKRKRINVEGPTDVTIFAE